MMLYSDEVEKVMEYVRKRHSESTCDYDNRQIAIKDSVWANLSYDIIQDILVAYIREKRKFEKEVNEKYSINKKCSSEIVKCHCVICKKRLKRKHFGFAGAGVGEINFGYGSKHDLMWGTVAICDKCIKPYLCSVKECKEMLSRNNLRVREFTRNKSTIKDLLDVD